MIVAPTDEEGGAPSPELLLAPGLVMGSAGRTGCLYGAGDGAGNHGGPRDVEIEQKREGGQEMEGILIEEAGRATLPTRYWTGTVRGPRACLEFAALVPTLVLVPE